MADFNFSDNSCPYHLTTQNLKVGIVYSRWNEKITTRLFNGAREVLVKEGLTDDQIDVIEVPGAFELAFGARMLIERGCDGVICLGCVIRGETPHFDYVCHSSAMGIMQVGILEKKPCIFGVLTTENEDQAMDRCGGKHGHKGKEAAQSALWMLAANQKS